MNLLRKTEKSSKRKNDDSDYEEEEVNVIKDDKKQVQQEIDENVKDEIASTSATVDDEPVVITDLDLLLLSVELKKKIENAVSIMKQSQIQEFPTGRYRKVPVYNEKGDKIGEKDEEIINIITKTIDDYTREDVIKTIFEDYNETVNHNDIRLHPHYWNQLLYILEININEITAKWIQDHLFITQINTVTNSPLYKEKGGIHFLRKTLLDRGEIGPFEAGVGEHRPGQLILSNGYIVLKTLYYYHTKNDVILIDDSLFGHKDKLSIVQSVHTALEKSKEQGDQDIKIQDIINLPNIRVRQVIKSDQLWRTILTNCEIKHKDILEIGDISHMLGDAFMGDLVIAVEGVQGVYQKTLTDKSEVKKKVDIAVKKMFVDFIQRFHDKFYFADEMVIKGSETGGKLQKMELVISEDLRVHLVLNHASTNFAIFWFHHKKLIDENMSLDRKNALVHEFKGEMAKVIEKGTQDVLDDVNKIIVDNGGKKINIDELSNTHVKTLQKLSLSNEKMLIYHKEVLVDCILKERKYTAFVTLSTTVQDPSNFKISVKKVDKGHEPSSKKQKTTTLMKQEVKKPIGQTTRVVYTSVDYYPTQDGSALNFVIYIELKDGSSSASTFQFWNVNLLQSPLTITVDEHTPTSSGKMYNNFFPFENHGLGIERNFQEDSDFVKHQIMVCGDQEGESHFDKNGKSFRLLTINATETSTTERYPIQFVELGFNRVIQGLVKKTTLEDIQYITHTLYRTQSNIYVMCLIKSKSRPVLELAVLLYKKVNHQWEQDRNVTRIALDIIHNSDTEKILDFNVVFLYDDIFYVQFKSGGFERNVTYTSNILTLLNAFKPSLKLKVLDQKSTYVNSFVLKRVYPIFDKFVNTFAYYLLYQCNNMPYFDIKFNYIFFKQLGEQTDENRDGSIIFVKIGVQTTLVNRITIENLKLDDIKYISVFNNKHEQPESLILIHYKNNSSGLPPPSRRVMFTHFNNVEYDAGDDIETLTLSSKPKFFDELTSTHTPTKRSMCHFCSGVAKFREVESDKRYCDDLCQDLDRTATTLSIFK